MSVLIRLLEEAAEGLHLLSDKLPPPGTADQSTRLATFSSRTFLSLVTRVFVSQRRHLRAQSAGLGFFFFFSDYLFSFDSYSIMFI